MSNDLTLSPFYHSSVNAVTEPGKTVFFSQYFMDRWAPLLGGNAVLIVMALRRLGYLNRKTGERRDEVVVGVEEIATRAGVSEDTVARILGVNKKTGKPNNAWIGQFVQPRQRSKRDKLGRVWQEQNGYWVAMDDPIHPDDWHLVEDAIRQAEERVEKVQRPDPQNAGPVERQRPQSSDSSPQKTGPDPHFADSSPQNAAPFKNPDSSRHKMTPNTPAAPGDSLSLFEDGGSEGEGSVPSAEEIRAVSEALRVLEAPRPIVKLADLQAEWDGMPPDAKERYRPEALRQLHDAGHPLPRPTLVEPTMFKLFWAEKKGLASAKRSVQ